MYIPIYRLGNLWAAIESGDFEDVAGTYDAPSIWKLTTLDLLDIRRLGIEKSAKYKDEKNKTIREDIIVIEFLSEPGTISYFKTDEPIETTYFKLVNLLNEVRDRY